jgi:hypothetical protein
MVVGTVEVFIIALVGLLSIGLPIVVLVFMVLLWRKVQRIEDRLNKS